MYSLKEIIHWLRWKKLTLIVIPLCALIIFVTFIKKIVLLSEAPSLDKNCHLLYPITTIDESKITHITINNQSLPFLQRGGTIDDSSCLNTTPIYGLIAVKNENDIKDALLFAKNSSLKVSLAGVRHSMGGQSFFKNAIVLDMKQFNQMNLDKDKKLLRVQSGATWHDIQNYVDPKGLSIKSMQSSDIFTVGGSISVNAHGMDHRVGSIGSTIKTMRIMLSDGTIQVVSREQNPELFSLVIGGYGLFGVILDVDLELIQNEMYERHAVTLPYDQFPSEFEEIAAQKDEYGLMYAHLSTAPSSFLKEVIIYKYQKINDYLDGIPSLQEKANVELKRFFLNLGKVGPIGMQSRYWAEKYLQPHFESCVMSRNYALGEGEACLTSRNQEMHDSGKFLRNNLKNDTDILQEYFIPRDKFTPFIDEIRSILTKHNAVVLNAGVRVVNKEENFLNYAPQDSFAIVLYINQKTTLEGNERMKQLTNELVNASIKVGGKPYLPYQLYFTDDQIRTAYPELDQFFKFKQKYDPNLTLMNSLYAKYRKED